MTRDMQSAVEPLRRFHPVSWDHIPDLGLYMDQVLTFITRIHGPLYGDDMSAYLSPSMINNYVKGGLIPRPAGKKYSREQIALLLMIFILKQACSMEDIRRMLSLEEGETVEALYLAFCQRFEQVLQAMCGGAEPVRAPESALDFAILASGYSLGCAAVLKFGGEQVQG